MKDAKKKSISLQDDDLQKVLSDYEAIERRHTPETFKLGRSLLQQIAPIERNLFDRMEDDTKENGVYRIAGIVHKITEKDFIASTIALSQINSNLSVKSGNTDTNTGMSTKYALQSLSELTGKPALLGDVCFTVNDFCRYAYGTADPSSKERKAAEALIKTLDETPVEIEYRNGNKIEARLAAVMQKDYNAKDNTKFYHLHLHPIFCDYISKGFAILRQDAITLMRQYCTEHKQKMTDTHYKLLYMLAQQKTTQDGTTKAPRVFKRSALELLQYLGMENEFRKSRARALQTIENVIEAVKATGIITGYKIQPIKINGKERFGGVDFYLNPKYAISRKGEQEDDAEDADYSELPPS